jgi:hypothetical protein
MIELSNDNLDHYFSLPNANTTELLLGKNPYDFVARKSNTLLVTIGDSWTWGADLTKENNGLHIDRNRDDANRLTSVYGGILSEQLQADFLNLGESGAGNWHIVRKLSELADISHNLNYEKIIIISVFTETARDFNSLDDVTIDYQDWLINNIVDYNSYYGFLKFINQQISNRIVASLNRLSSKCKVYFGTNFIDPIGYEALHEHFLNHTWLEIICQCNNLKYVPNNCYVVFPWVIEKFESLFDFAPELDRTQWLTWVTELTDFANMRAELCKQDSNNFNQLLHPTAKNHKHFAEYLIKQL